VLRLAPKDHGLLIGPRPFGRRHGRRHLRSRPGPVPWPGVWLILSVRVAKLELTDAESETDVCAPHGRQELKRRSMSLRQASAAHSSSVWPKKTILGP
jgi:hypothetical protein